MLINNILIVILLGLTICSFIYEAKKYPKIVFYCLIPIILIMSFFTVHNLKLAKYDSFMSLLFSTLIFNECFIYGYLKLKDMKIKEKLWFDIFFWIIRLIELTLIYFSIVTII